MPPAHVTACKGPPLCRSQLRNGTGCSGHPLGTRHHGTVGRHCQQHRDGQAEASSASKVALAPCPRAGGHPSCPPAPSPHGEQCLWDPSMVLQRVQGARLEEMLPDTRPGVLSCLLLLLTWSFRAEPAAQGS